MIAAIDLILIVEDDDTLRYLGVLQLKKLGYLAHYATNGKEAVRLFEQFPMQYRLILMDVMMPVMDGCEATGHIRTIEAKIGRQHIPIIAMTAFQDRFKCHEAGMDDYLFKPVLLDDLSKKLQQWTTG